MWRVIYPQEYAGESSWGEKTAHLNCPLVDAVSVSLMEIPRLINENLIKKQQHICRFDVYKHHRLFLKLTQMLSYIYEICTQPRNFHYIRNMRMYYKAKE